MKNHLIYLFFLPLVLLFLSCEEDDNSADSSGELNIENVAYTLDKGILENWGTAEENDELDENYEGYLLGLTLVSPEVVIHQTNGKVDSLSGIGHGIYFRIIAESPTVFNNHIFNIMESNIPGKLVNAVAMVNFDFLEDGIDDYISVGEGSLSINKINEEFVIQFNGTLNRDNQIELQYTGKLVIFDVGL